MKRNRTNNLVDKSLSLVLIVENPHSFSFDKVEKILNQNFDNIKVEIIIPYFFYQDVIKIVPPPNLHPNLTIRTIELDQDPSFISKKKYQISIGMKSAKNKWVLILEGYIVPDSKNWLERMVQNVQDEKQILLGYSRYKKQKNIQTAFYAFKHFQTSLQSLAFALSKKPFIGDPYNTIYDKNLYLNDKKLSSFNLMDNIEHTYFFNSISNDKNVWVVLEPESFVEIETDIVPSLWRKNSTNNLKLFGSFKLIHSVLTSLFSISYFFFYVSFFITLFIDFRLSIYIFLFRFLFVHLFYFFVSRKLRQKFPFLHYILFDLYLFIYYLKQPIRYANRNQN